MRKIKEVLIHRAQIFLATLGASNYTFAEATLSQDLPSWIQSHVHAFEFFRGVAEILVPDNLRDAVTRSCRYEPDLNASYREMAEHYGAVIIPARVAKPRDKANVESGVFQVERWVLAPPLFHESADKGRCNSDDLSQKKQLLRPRLPSLLCQSLVVFFL